MKPYYLRPRVFQADVFEVETVAGELLVIPTTEWLPGDSPPHKVSSYARLLPSEVSTVKFLPKRWVWHCHNPDLLEMTSYAHAESKNKAWDALVALHTNLFEVRLQEGTWVCACPDEDSAQAVARALYGWALVDNCDVLLMYAGTEDEARALWKRLGFDCR